MNVLQLQSDGFLMGPMAERQITALLSLNETTAAYGLTLTAIEAREIVAAHAKSLHDSARIEFGEGIAAKLVKVFADSPYLTQENYAETVTALLGLFDTFKNELHDAYNDRELLTFMRNAFDGECGGSTEILEAEVFPRLLTDTVGAGYRCAADARFAENETACVSALESVRVQIRRQHTQEDREADGKVYDAVPEVWEDENGRQV